MPRKYNRKTVTQPVAGADAFAASITGTFRPLVESLVQDAMLELVRGWLSQQGLQIAPAASPKAASEVAAPVLPVSAEVTPAPVPTAPAGESGENSHGKNGSRKAQPAAPVS